MTAETSNARGEVPYDRELIARMLDVCGHPKFTLDAYREQADLIRAADNASAQAETVSRPPAEPKAEARELLDAKVIDSLINANQEIHAAAAELASCLVDAVGAGATDIPLTLRAGTALRKYESLTESRNDR